MSIYQLPTEIRWTTYESLMVSDHPMIIEFDQVLSLPNSAAAIRPRNIENNRLQTYNIDPRPLALNHPDRQRCVEILCSNNIFKFLCDQDLSNLLAQLDSFRLFYPHHASLIRHITIPFPAFPAPENYPTSQGNPSFGPPPNYSAALRNLRDHWTNLRQITFEVDTTHTANIFELPESIASAAVDNLSQQLLNTIPRVNINVKVKRYEWGTRDPRKRDQQIKKMSSFTQYMELFQGWNVSVEAMRTA
jgi:hypothetical protein